MRLLKCTTLSICLFSLACSDDPEAPEFDIVATDEFAMGSLAIQGTVTLPGALRSGTFYSIAMRTSRSSGITTANLIQRGTARADQSSVRYKIEGLDAGQYYVFLLADSNADMNYGSGDYAGFYAGTTSAPIQDGQMATEIELTTTSKLDADFGIATLP